MATKGTKFKKSDLIEYLAGKLEVTKKQAEDMVEAFLAFITDTLKRGDELTLTGFGTFLAKERKGRLGINPKNVTQRVEIPPSIVPRFKAGKALKEALQVKK